MHMTFEQVLEEDQEKMSMNLSDTGYDSDTDIKDDFTASNEKQENDLPDSVLTYFKASSNRVNTFEQLILEDLDELETMCHTMLSPSQDGDLNEQGSNHDDEPLKLKERIMSEIEEEVGLPRETHDLNGDYDTEYNTHKDSERQLMFEWRKLEERLGKEEEQRLAELEAEREQRLKSAREEEEKTRRRRERFKEELRRIKANNQFEYLKPVEGDGELSQSLQLEMVKHQELIKKLEEQITEERRVFEEMQQEERRRTETRCTAAATKLQAAFRGTLVRHWSRKELTERKRQEEKAERERRREWEERMKMEWLMERSRVEQEEQRHREEADRRRAEYEKAKERERHRLEKERNLEEQRRKEKEEAKRVEDERKRKEEEKQKMMGQRRVEEEMKKVEDEEEKKIKEEKLKIIEDESTERIEERSVEEERREVKEDEERTRKEEEKTKRIEGERKRKDEGKQKETEERRAEEERKRKEVEDTTRIGHERKRKEKEKSMEIRRMEEENGKVQVEEEKERKQVEEAKRTEDERRRRKEEKQKLMHESRVEEDKKRKEEGEEKRTDAEINRKEEKQKGMNEKRVVEEFRLKQEEQHKENETKQVQKVQREKLKEKDVQGEETVMKRNDDGQNTEERSRDLIKDNVNGLADQRENPETDKESKDATKCGKDEKSSDNVSQLCLSQSVNMSKSFLARTLSSRNGQDEQLSCHIVLALSTQSADDSSVTVSPPEEKSVTDPRGLQSALDDSSSACLPDSAEEKRLAWMMNCTPWSELSMQNKRKGGVVPPRRRARRRASRHSLLPLPVDTVLTSGPWSSLKQVTSVTLEDLSGCSLSTLSECTRLQSLMLRRCGLQALDGLNECAELQHIDVQENNITYVDCGGLTRLKVLLLGKNQLTSIHGLDDAVNLTVLQLSHNIISHIGGLGTLKKLHRLTVDHNQLISTRGLGEAYTLLHLDCSFNHFNRVEGLENCALLNMLDLRGNNLTEVPALENHVLLRELYLDDNSICSLHGLDSCWLPLLRCLSVPQNSITQLPLLVDLLSLKTLNVSHNCLSELRNICMSLQGCAHLQELNIADNPVQQENNWRSSVLAVNPSLIKLNGEQTGASGTLSADSTQLWSFRALCQAHHDQLESVLQRHSREISSAPSALHAQLLLGKHAAELFQLAEKQRYAHEYGDSGVCETAVQEPVTSSHLQELSDCDLGQEKSAEANAQQPAAHNTQSVQAAHLPNLTHKCQPPSGDHNAECAGSCMNPSQKFRDTQPSEDRHSRYGVQASRMDLKTVAVTVIQRCWREYRRRRRTGHFEPPAKAHARLSLQREVKSCKTRPECLNKDYAATVIQAVWRGYMLRKRLSRALMLTQISDGDEAFQEVDVDEFVFDEEAIERDWIALNPDMSPSSVLPYSEELPLPKPLLPLPELHKSASVQPRQAWISDEEAPVSERSQSPDPSTRMQSPASTLGKCSLSARYETILQEWGFNNDSTARLMLKRAQRMKARKQQHQRKLLDPVVRLAVFRNHNLRPAAMTIQRSRPEFKEEIKADKGDASVQQALRGEPEQTQTQTQTGHRTCQWLQTQAMPSWRRSAPSKSDHFLPEIDPEILTSGRVQLVAPTGYRETPDSTMRQWADGAGFPSPQNHQNRTRTHSAGHAKKEVLSPQRVTLAPPQKERISFRVNPVQLSGGWGGGKKRSKANKLK